ncbi:MAG: Tn3 family transposase [Chitinispirillia bacterium]|jgi:TnpA family transposase
MEYPHIYPNICKEEIIEHFTLTKTDQVLLSKWRKGKNILGFAILLKSFVYLGYPLRYKQEVPQSVISYISSQLNQDPILFNSYRWKGTIWDDHLASIRDFTGFKPHKKEDIKMLINWLVYKNGEYQSRQKMYLEAIKRLRALHLELPTEKELRRIINSAWYKYFTITCQKITERLNPEIRERIDICLNTDSHEHNSYKWLKGNPGKFGLKSILREVNRRSFIDKFGINDRIIFADILPEFLKLLRDRAFPENAYQIKRHKKNIRYALMAAIIHFRRMEITDNIVKIFLHLIRKIEKRADKSLENKLIKNIEKVYGKNLILYKISLASIYEPKGSIQDVLYPVIGKNVFHKIINEYENQEKTYINSRVEEKKTKYKHFYRKMMKPVMDTLIFRSNNPSNQSLLDGIELIRKYLEKKNAYYPIIEDIPQDLITGYWQDVTIEVDQGVPRVVKHYFELCVLQKLEKAIKCKEIWIEHSYKYRDPDKDLPQNWQVNRVNYCRKHLIPQKPEDFIEPIREELNQTLENTNEFFSRKKDVYIYCPGDGNTGFFRIPKILKKPTCNLLQEIKNKVIQRWGILNLSDILLEADRRVNFARFFYSTGQRHVLSYSEIRERLLISILGKGTGLGLKRIHSAAKPSFSYDDLLYFNKRFVHRDSLHEAIVFLFNTILEVRNPEIWKSSSACTSDAKYLSAWEQNLSTEWNPHYKKYGIMSYWHVDNKSAGIYSQIRGTSEVAAMIAGLVLNNTSMNIESNYVDSLGQSEMGFTFCRFLSVELMPWLKRMKYERLYSPDNKFKNRLPYLANVLERPIRWHEAYIHYDDMIRHVVAAKERTGPIDSIIRRFNKNNPANPTYKGFIELGKALKTIHNCKFLTDKSYREQIHNGRNIIESWNSVTDFIGYGGKTDISTNNPEDHEIIVLCLHLLQNAIVLVNTMMLEKVLQENGFLIKMQEEDLNSLTPLFTSNVNPYGNIQIDLNKPSIFQ